MKAVTNKEINDFRAARVAQIEAAKVTDDFPTIKRTVKVIDSRLV